MADCITLSDSNMKMHAPTETRALTANPALRRRNCRSKPMTMPATKAHISRFVNTESGIFLISIFLVFIVRKRRAVCSCNDYYDFPFDLFGGEMGMHLAQ